MSFLETAGAVGKIVLSLKSNNNQPKTSMQSANLACLYRRNTLYDRTSIFSQRQVQTWFCIIEQKRKMSYNRKLIFFQHLTKINSDKFLYFSSSKTISRDPFEGFQTSKKDHEY